MTCTNGGVFSNTTFTAPTVTVETTSICTATASDAAGNTATATINITVLPESTVLEDVEITGKITFDKVPHNTTTSGLDYASTTQEPVRGATVELLDSADAVLHTSVTDALGNYSFTVTANTPVKVRVRSELKSSAGATWDVKVTDNTNGNAVYALQGTLSSSGDQNSVRNLNAMSGWGGSSYTLTRAAAPFAILDPIYDAMTAFAAVDADVVFPPTEFRWSTLNKSESGDPTTGQIGTSSYVRTSTEAVGNVYILGDANSDTDEYDTHVVVHEWGHYFEDQMSRSDSVGGNHSGGDSLDPRVAMGEGWGNALSGIITNDPFYRDSSGAMQAQGFFINVDTNTVTNPGWFNESSVQAILYDLYDSADDNSDTISLGLGPIYEAFTSTAYTGLDYYTTIFSFLDVLKAQQPASSAAIDSLSAAQTINGTGPDGVGETNDGGASNALPIYNAISVNGGPVSICSTDDTGRSNKLGNREYLRVDIATAGEHTFIMTRTSGATSTDPDFSITQGVSVLGYAATEVSNSETLAVNLVAGIYLIDAYDYNNVGTMTTQADSCFNFTITN